MLQNKVKVHILSHIYTEPCVTHPIFFRCHFPTQRPSKTLEEKFIALQVENLGLKAAKQKLRTALSASEQRNTDMKQELKIVQGELQTANTAKKKSDAAVLSLKRKASADAEQTEQKESIKTPPVKKLKSSTENCAEMMNAISTTKKGIRFLADLEFNVSMESVRRDVIIGLTAADIPSLPTVITQELQAVQLRSISVALDTDAVVPQTLMTAMTARCQRDFAKMQKAVFDSLHEAKRAQELLKGLF